MLTFELAIPGSDDSRWTRRDGVLIRRDEGITKWVQGDTTTVKLTAAQTNGALGVLETVVNPGGGAIPHALDERKRPSTLFRGISTSSMATRPFARALGIWSSSLGEIDTDSPMSVRFPPPC